jgi:hypothetical protein
MIEIARETFPTRVAAAQYVLDHLETWRAEAGSEVSVEYRDVGAAGVLVVAETYPPTFRRAA